MSAKSQGTTFMIHSQDEFKVLTKSSGIFFNSRLELRLVPKAYIMVLTHHSLSFCYILKVKGMDNHFHCLYEFEISIYWN